MAYNYGELLDAAQTSYTLGEYTFNASFEYKEGPDKTTCVIIMTKDGQQATRRQTVDGQVQSWYVDANDTTADVYVLAKPSEYITRNSDLSTFPYIKPIPVSTSMHSEIVNHSNGNISIEDYASEAVSVGWAPVTGYLLILAASTASAIYTHREIWIRNGSVYRDVTETDGFPLSYEYNGKTAYCSWIAATDAEQTHPDTYNRVERVDYSPAHKFNTVPGSYSSKELDRAIPKVAWTMLYGTEEVVEGEEIEKLFARFAIDLHDAGGTFPGIGWYDIGDWNIEPATILNLDVTGALSGRHNDPLNDTSYHYLPADKATVAPYGSGGDGGHGGGGGAGASTAIVYNFGTNNANGKEITVMPRRHGYGSGGGKGGKGGDGCILIYY